MFKSPSLSLLGKKWLVLNYYWKITWFFTDSYDNSRSKQQKKGQKCIKATCPGKITYHRSIAKYSESLNQCKCVKQ